jgi:hypothetical protein
VGRPLPATRGREKAQTYPVKLTVLCDDRTGMLKEFTAIISDDGTNIRSVANRSSKRGGRSAELGKVPGGGGLCGGDGGRAAPERWKAGAESAQGNRLSRVPCAAIRLSVQRVQKI